MGATSTSEIKVVGKSGQISLGKRYAGKTLEWAGQTEARESEPNSLLKEKRKRRSRPRGRRK